MAGNTGVLCEYSLSLLRQLRGLIKVSADSFDEDDFRSVAVKTGSETA